MKVRLSSDNVSLVKSARAQLIARAQDAAARIKSELDSGHRAYGAIRAATDDYVASLTAADILGGYDFEAEPPARAG